MNFDVLLLFLDIMLTMLCVAGIVLWILRREYLPVIRRLERGQGVPDGTAAPAHGDGRSSAPRLSTTPRACRPGRRRRAPLPRPRWS